MNRPIFRPLALALFSIALTCSLASRSFGTSPPLESTEQFIPEKPVVRHPAMEMTPERGGGDHRLRGNAAA